MKLLLACSGGYSSSILVDKIINAGKDRKIKVECKAVSISEAIDIGSKWDIILLAPQVKFLAEELRNKSKTPILDVEPKDYALGKGDNVLSKAIKLLEGK